MIKSNIKIVKRINGTDNTLTSNYSGFDFGLIGAIKNVLAGDRDIDHAVIKVREEEEDWDGFNEWGMC